MTTERDIRPIAVDPAELRRFGTHVDRVADRLLEASRTADGDPVEDLQLAVEELQVAKEELLVQEEVLHDAWTTAEVERARYDELFNTAPVGLLVTDATGVVHKANHVAGAMVGVRPDLLVGKPLAVYAVRSDEVHALVREVGRDHPASALIELCGRGAPPQQVMASVNRLHGGDGEVQWALTPATTSHGTPLGAWREAQLVDRFRGMVDHLTRDADSLEVLTDLCVDVRDVLGLAAAGVHTVDADGRPSVITASDDDVRVVELLQTEHDGPASACLASGRAVVAGLDEAARRWPEVHRALVEEGFRTIAALPMPSRGDVVGTLNIFSEATGIPPSTLRAAQSLADVAMLVITTKEQHVSTSQLVGQLQHALDSRVVIEQAKGILAERRGCTPVEAFDALRRWSRANNQKVQATARAIVEGRLDDGALPWAAA